MLHVLLVILKIIGIVLLAILLIVLFLFLLVLFVPVRYQAYASKNKELYAKINASWLLHFIHIHIYLDKNGLVKSFRVLGISVDKWKEFLEKLKHLFTVQKPKKKIKNKTKTKSKKVNELDENKTTSQDSMEMSRQIKQETQNNEQASLEQKNTINTEPSKKIEEPVKEKKKNGKNPIYYLKKWYERIVSRIKKFICQIKNILKKVIATLKNVKDKLEDIKIFLQDEDNKQAFMSGKEQLFRVIRHIKPKKYKINLKFGTGDPALTGQILGIFGMLMPIYKNNAHIVPDFENVILEGDIFIKGRITLAKLIIIGWKLYRDKNIKRCYKMIVD